MIVQTDVTLSHLSLEIELRSQLGPGVAVVCTGVDGDPNDLWPEEFVAVAGAIPRRQREFAAGRAAARAAMRLLQRPQKSVPSLPDRSPRWPEDLVGSIAHSADVCIAVLGARDEWESIGIDIEPATGIEETLWDTICNPHEKLELLKHAQAMRASHANRVFVAKEAFYKWYYPQKRKLLDFHSVTVKWAPDGSSFLAMAKEPDSPANVANCIGRVFSSEGSLVAYCATRVATRPTSTVPHCFPS